MSLRLTLLCIGLVILVGVFLHSRGVFSRLFSYRPKLPLPTARERKEPVLDADDSVDVSPQDTPAEPQQFGRLHQVGQVEPNEPAVEKKIVAIRLVPEHDEAFPAEKLILAMRGRGLVHGELGIFHRADSDGVDAGTFCIANLVEPGSFDLTQIHDSSYPGVSIFMILPIVSGGVEAFDDMLAVSRDLASDLDGILLDEAGLRMSIQRERYLREEVIEYERQRSGVARQL